MGCFFHDTVSPLYTCLLLGQPCASALFHQEHRCWRTYGGDPVMGRSVAAGPSCWPCPSDSVAAPPPAAGLWGCCRVPCAPCNKHTHVKTLKIVYCRKKDKHSQAFPTTTTTLINVHIGNMHKGICTRMQQQRKKSKKKQKTIAKQRLALWHSSRDKKINVLHTLCSALP